jgi:hypothetical protein
MFADVVVVDVVVFLLLLFVVVACAELDSDLTPPA